MAISTCLSMSFPTRTTITSGFGTRARFGATRSGHSQTNILPSTRKRNSPGSSLVPGSDNAMRRTSRWVATGDGCYTLAVTITELRVPKDIEKVVAALEKAGHAAYVVGGCVRDAIRGVDPQDWDIATDATPERDPEALREVALHQPLRHRGRPIGRSRGRGHDVPRRGRLHRSSPPRSRRVHRLASRGPLAPRLHDERDGLAARQGRHARRARGLLRGAARSRGAHPAGGRRAGRALPRGRAADAARGALRDAPRHEDRRADR